MGNGAYATVNLVQCSINDEEYALKIVDKNHLQKHDKVESVMRERDNLFKLVDHPNIVRLELTFQDDESLFFLLEYAQNGELTNLIKEMKEIPFELTQFFAAEIVNALECLRKN